MEGLSGDLFATKGVEYLLVITYLLLLVGGWRLVFPKRPHASSRPHERTLRSDLYFHQGHTWAAIQDRRIVRVGIDDFAQHAIGLPVRLTLPPLSSEVVQGEPAIGVRLANGETIPILSPVSGTVVGVNGDVFHSPGIVNTQPYDEGWLMQVRVPSVDAVRRNLLSGELAECWMEQARHIPDDEALDALMMTRTPVWAAHEAT